MVTSWPARAVVPEPGVLDVLRPRDAADVPRAYRDWVQLVMTPGGLRATDADRCEHHWRGTAAGVAVATVHQSAAASTGAPSSGPAGGGWRRWRGTTAWPAGPVEPVRALLLLSAGGQTVARTSADFWVERQLRLFAGRHALSFTTVTCGGFEELEALYPAAPRLVVLGGRHERSALL